MRHSRPGASASSPRLLRLRTPGARLQLCAVFSLEAEESLLEVLWSLQTLRIRFARSQVKSSLHISVEIAGRTKHRMWAGGEGGAPGGSPHPPAFRAGLEAKLPFVLVLLGVPDAGIMFLDVLCDGNRSQKLQWLLAM